MHQMVSTPVDSSRGWWVLTIVVAAQFMFGVDAFIVNVAIPTIATELHITSAQIEAVIAVYLIAYATLAVSGGRLGDIYGTKKVFLIGASSVVFGWNRAPAPSASTASCSDFAGAAGFLLGGVL